MMNLVKAQSNLDGMGGVFNANRLQRNQFTGATKFGMVGMDEFDVKPLTKEESEKKFQQQIDEKIRKDVAKVREASELRIKDTYESQRRLLLDQMNLKREFNIDDIERQRREELAQANRDADEKRTKLFRKLKIGDETQLNTLAKKEKLLAQDELQIIKDELELNKQLIELKAQWQDTIEFEKQERLQQALLLNIQHQSDITKEVATRSRGQLLPFWSNC